MNRNVFVVSKEAIKWGVFSHTGIMSKSKIPVW